MNEPRSLQLNIDEGTIHLVFAAFRLGRGDPLAEPPEALCLGCIRLLAAKDLAEARRIVDEFTEVESP